MEKNWDEHIDNLVDIMDSIPVDGSITLLTGSNGSGKSLIRKQMVLRVAEAKNVDIRKTVSSTSMELRTKSQPEFGGLGGIMRDTEWMPTSYSTLKLLEGLLEIKDRYLIIDEPEIGMGEETVMALVNYLNEKLANTEGLYGVMIITHNRYIVENLKYDHFYNIDGLKTKEEWVNRELIPTDLEALRENKLFSAVRDRQNKNKQ